MNNPKVSVIIPNYNYARYLDQRIQSVLNQTYQDFEVIILDDCSTDNSLEVINKYKDNPHISQIVVNEVNSGSTFKQWDKGIHLAKGEIIWIAESDDYCELNLLEELVKAYEHKPDTVLAYTTSVALYEDTGKRSWSKQFKNKYCSGAHYCRHYLSIGCMVFNASSAIFSRKAALYVPDTYQTSYAAGDYWFWIGIAKQGNIAIVSKGLNYWRRHSQTVTSGKTADGSNLHAEMDIYQDLNASFHFSFFRRMLAFTHRASQIFEYEFVSEGVRNEVSELWHASRYKAHFFVAVETVAEHLRKYYNIYL